MKGNPLTWKYYEILRNLKISYIKNKGCRPK
jgi:hypothetical protein